MLDHNQEQMPKAINKRISGGRTVPTKLEDMYPFLSTEELNANNYHLFVLNYFKLIIPYFQNLILVI